MSQTEKMQREYFDVARTLRMVKCVELAQFKVLHGFGAVDRMLCRHREKNERVCMLTF